ncbi:hypothetical protein ABPG74_002687 [Tetrahymena malaccensis]
MYSIVLDKGTSERKQLVEISEKSFDFNSVSEEHYFSIQNSNRDKSVLIKFLCPTHFQYVLRLSCHEQENQDSSRRNSCEQVEEAEQSNQNGEGSYEYFPSSNSIEIFAGKSVDFMLCWNNEGIKDLEINSNLQQIQSNINRISQQDQSQQFLDQGEGSYNQLDSFDGNGIIKLQHNNKDKMVILVASIDQNIIDDCGNQIQTQESFGISQKINQHEQKDFSETDYQNQIMPSGSTTSLESMYDKYKQRCFKVISGSKQMKIWAKIDKKQIHKQELIINNFFLSHNNPTYSCLYVQKIMECTINHKGNQSIQEQKRSSELNQKGSDEMIGKEDDNNRIDGEFRLEHKINIRLDRNRATARTNITPLGSCEGIQNLRDYFTKEIITYRDSNCQCCDEPIQICCQNNLKITKEEKDIISMHVKNSIDQHSSMIFENNTVLYQFSKISKQLKEFFSDVWVLQEDQTQDLGVLKIIYFIVGKQSSKNYFAIQERQQKSKSNKTIRNCLQSQNPFAQQLHRFSTAISQTSQCSPSIKGVSTSYSSIQSNTLNYIKTGKSSDDQNLLSSDTESVESSQSPIRNQASNRQSLYQDENCNANNRFSCETYFATSSSSQVNFSELNTPTNQKKNSNIITPRQVQDKLKNLNPNDPYQTCAIRNSPIMNADANKAKEANQIQTIYEIGGEEENSYRDQNQFMRKQNYMFDFPSTICANSDGDEKYRQTAPVYDMNHDASIHHAMHKSCIPGKDSSDLNYFENEDFRKSKLKQPRSKKEGSITTEQKNVKHIILSDDSLHFITATECGLVTVWNISTQEKTIFDDHKKSCDPSINFLKSMNDGDRFMTGGGDKTVKIYSLKQMKLIHTIEVERKIVYSAAILPDLNMIAVGGLNISKLASIGKSTTKRRNIKFYNLQNYKYIKKFKIPSSENIITHLEYCQTKQSNCYYQEDDRKAKSNATIKSNYQYRQSTSGTKTESSDNEGSDERQSVQSMYYKSTSSPKLNKFNNNVLACVVQGSYGSRLIFIHFGRKGKMEIILNCEMLTIGIYKVHRFFYSHSMQKLICMPKPNEKKGQTINYFYEIDISSRTKIESLKHTPSFEKPIIDLNLCSDQNIIIVIPTENYFYLYDVKDQAIIDRSNTLDFPPKQAYVSPLNFAAIQLESGNGKINLFKLPSQVNS